MRTEEELERAARIAYHRRCGADAPIPSVDIDEVEGIVELHNVNGMLGAFRITNDGRLRWSPGLSRRCQRKHDAIQGRCVRRTGNLQET